ncbi:MAG: porin family protein [Cytophagales bacterium]|nr:porin family protein [Cytophagales bacterium]
MKGIIFLILALNVSVLSAQSSFQIGIRGGLNYVNNIYKINDIGESGNEYRFGYHLGVQGKFKVMDRFFFSPEISWNNKGYYNAGINQLGNFNEAFAFIHFLDESNTHLNYVSLPLLVEFRPVSKIGLLLGPEISYLISAKASLISSDTDVDMLELWESVNIVNRIDFGLTGGVEYRLYENLTLGI